tara:strand:- start:6353 stop:7828 length:1476 start_codon:yes stop_codon:yes gene_type:complete
MSTSTTENETLHDSKIMLEKVSSLRKSYEKLAKSTGENFNIFQVMGMESNEVKTHSAIIGHLLDPNGSHGLGCKPLELFLKQITPIYNKEELKEEEEKILSGFKLNTQSCKAKVEDHIGKINEEGTEGGRIDIVIKDHLNNAILIENKIYAREQLNQLYRYKKRYPNAPILFLTLDGKDAESIEDSKSKKNTRTEESEESDLLTKVIGEGANKLTLKQDEDYFLVSYEKDILQWIENCLKEAVKFPMLREVLQQYIYLIKKLTNQTLNTELKMEISDLIKDNFLAAAEIDRNFNSVKNNILNDLWNELSKKIIKNTELNKLFNNELYVENIQFKFDKKFNYILIGNNAMKGICYFYFRFNKENFHTANGIMFDPDYMFKVNEWETKKGKVKEKGKFIYQTFINETKNENIIETNFENDHYSGIVSLVSLKKPFPDVKNNELLINYLTQKNKDIEKGTLEETHEEMVKYVIDNIGFYKQIAKFMKNNKKTEE